MRTSIVHRVLGFAAGVLVLGCAGSAFAQYYYPPPPPPPGYYQQPPPGYYAPPPPPFRPMYARPPPPPPKFLTLTFQPLMLLPIEQPQELFELSAEFRTARWLGLQLLGGVGGWQDPDGLSGTNYELGGEANFYVVGGFRRGVQLAPFVKYTGSGVGSSLEWGGLLGYKWTSWAGFTWLAQFGVGVIDTLTLNDSANSFGDGTVPNDVTLPWTGDYTYLPGSTSVVGFFRLGIGWSI